MTLCSNLSRHWRTLSMVQCGRCCVPARTHAPPHLSGKGRGFPRVTDGCASVHMSVNNSSIVIVGRNTLTQALTPPINPKLYPVAKSSFRPFPMGLSDRPTDSTRDRWVFMVPVVGLTTFPRVLPMSILFLALGAGLPGRLFCQSCRNSRPSSWPVLVQLCRILSRISATCRLISSSFFFSHDTFSSCLEAPRLNWREMYWS